MFTLSHQIDHYRRHPPADGTSLHGTQDRPAVMRTLPGRLEFAVAAQAHLQSAPAPRDVDPFAGGRAAGWLERLFRRPLRVAEH